MQPRQSLFSCLAVQLWNRARRPHDAKYLKLGAFAAFLLATYVKVQQSTEPKRLRGAAHGHCFHFCNRPSVNGLRRYVPTTNTYGMKGGW